MKCTGALVLVSVSNTHTWLSVPSLQSFCLSLAPKLWEKALLPWSVLFPVFDHRFIVEPMSKVGLVFVGSVAL